LGLVLLASFLIAGRGIGASGAISQSLAHSADFLNISNAYLEEQKYSNSFWSSWIVIEVIGIFIGAFLSAKFAGRIKKETIKGDSISHSSRLRQALIGGLLMGLAARLARGCTSGQALSGGAMLSVGSWAFMLSIFIGAYIAIVFVRKSWS
ncbi:MAG: YeeE/YedE family protein, partial [Kangiellaceae bacterium]|nr:YeeE/YedE family protein [Kangiellaceae bacterium]